jgi:hypothetical protein
MLSDAKDQNGDLAVNHGPSPPSPRHIATTINYYNDPGDGLPPMPVYVGGGSSST